MQRVAPRSGCDDDGRANARSAQATQRLDSVHSGHLVIEQDEVELRAGPEALKRFCAARHRFRRGSDVANDRGGRFARRGAVVDDQHIFADHVALDPIGVGARLRVDDGDGRREAEDAARARLAFNLDLAAEQVRELDGVIARPRPVPPKRREIDASACANGRNSAAICSARHPDAGVGDFDVERHARRHRAVAADLAERPRPPR